jgi:hypothetical protein
MPNANAVDGVLRIIPQRAELTLSKAEAAAILEIAFLAIAADRKLRDEELTAFRQIAARLKQLASPEAANAPAADDISDQELNKILDSFSGDMERDVADERLRVLGGELKRTEVRHTAYRVAYALALCDLDTSDAEFEFDLQLIDALELTPAEAEELESQVLDAFQRE